MSNGEAGNYLPGDPRYGLSGEALKDYYRKKAAQWAIYCWDKPGTAETRRALLTDVGPPAYVRSATVFLYPHWWINRNIGLLEEREKATLAAFPPAEIVASRIDAILAFDRTVDLPKLKLPTLILCAKDDLITPPYFSGELAALIPGAKFVELAYGGHCASDTNAQEFNDAVLGFVARHS